MSDKIAKATALILVLAGLFFAIGKLGDAWQYACKTLDLCPEPKHEWVAEPAAELSKVIKADTAFTFSHLSGAGPGQPQVGNQRYDGDAVVSSCSGGVPIVWQLPNGKIVYDDDPLVQNGWSSSSYVGQPPALIWRGSIPRRSLKSAGHRAFTPIACARSHSTVQYPRLLSRRIRRGWITRRGTVPTWVWSTSPILALI